MAKRSRFRRAKELLKINRVKIGAGKNDDEVLRIGPGVEVKDCKMVKDVGEITISI